MPEAPGHLVRVAGCPGMKFIALLVAGMAAGAINTIVGAGTLITFPTLLFFGYRRWSPTCQIPLACCRRHHRDSWLSP